MNLRLGLRIHFGFHVAQAGYIHRKVWFRLRVMACDWFFLSLAYRHSTAKGELGEAFAFLVQL